ncbi:MAG TPA: PEP/pyruvate-binding domain-containing protein, partial [Chthoniobacteraceae bacterium]|nr:PEP/pyruvate-binding domain-containing protein [Chthoniobacteraceae bacterium]
KAAILSALTGAGFQPSRMLRFRSSSNAEDTSQFSGAGLYESFNGCIADSQDGDGDGPSHCCPDEPEEKTVLGALEKVFASFYNDNAWLERLRHGIRESQVGMAVLVHENARDEDEMANGVATITRRPGFEPGRAEYEFNIVTQAGAVSVTNPDGGAKPEIVIGGQSGSDNPPFLFTQQHSDLVQLGANVMTWESDYRDLLGLFVKVAKGYAQLFPEKATFTLDLEFKKLVPGVLQVKQVRELPQPRERLVKPILLNEPTEWVVFQGEFADAFAYHRLKCVLTASTLNTKLNATLAAPLHRDCTFDFVLNGALSNLGNGPFAWPGYRFLAPRPGLQLDLWKASGEASAVTYRLRSTIPTQADAAVGPVLTQRDFNGRLVAIYKTPQPYLDFDGVVKTRSSDAASLIPRGELIPESALQTRRIQTPAGVVIDPQFHWPDYSDGGFVIIKTFPLAAWDHTTITGLTTSPLVLTDDFAQTYAPGHHNFTEVFLFEPALDPGITPEQRAELEAANIRMIHVFHDRALGFGDTIRVLGFDGAFRLLP